ncbi:MAG: GGDEF domain-containing protein [Actinomycetota bacterium]
MATPTPQPTSDMTSDDVAESFGELSTLAPVAMRIVQVADDEDASMADLVNVIGLDPALTAKLLRVANSALYGQSTEVTSLLRATTLLGTQTVKLLALGFSLVDSLCPPELPSNALWRRSLTASVIGRCIANESHPRVADDAFVGGLLGNIGKFALVGVPAYADAVAEANAWPPIEAEADIVGFTSDEVSALIMEKWGLPAAIHEAVHWRSAPELADAAHDAAAILHVADAAAEFMLSTGEPQAVAYDVLSLAAAGQLGWSMAQIEEILTDATPDLNDIAKLFDLGAITDTPVVELMIHAQTLVAKVSLEMTAALTQQQERNEALSEANKRLHNQASTDALTGLPNRRTFDAYLSNQIAGRLKRPRKTDLGLILIDLDHFKAVNDTYGHHVGDEVLQAVGARIMSATRRSELSARIGGEEFAVVLPDTQRNELPKAAERFRSLIAADPIDTSSGPLEVTASIGAAQVQPTAAETRDELFATADKALYDSKAGGRNMATVST